MNDPMTNTQTSENRNCTGTNIYGKHELTDALNWLKPHYYYVVVLKSWLTSISALYIRVSTTHVVTSSLLCNILRMRAKHGLLAPSRTSCTNHNLQTLRVLTLLTIKHIKSSEHPLTKPCPVLKFQIRTG